MNGRNPAAWDRPRDYDALQREIRAHQTRVDETIGALRRKFARLAPRHLMEQTMNRMHSTSSSDPDQRNHGHGTRGGHAGGWSSSVGDTMRANPLPLALIGIGVGWLALSGSGYNRRIARSDTVHTIRDRAGEAAHYARDTFYGATDSVREAAAHAYERTSEAMGSASESIRGMGGGGGGGQTYGGGEGGRRPGTEDHGHRHGLMARERMHSATSSLWEMVDDHPLVAGVLGVALGAALGASIPSTRYEDRWIGDYADEASHRAKELAQEAVERGTRAARAAAEAAREEVGQAASAASEAAKEEAGKPT